MMGLDERIFWLLLGGAIGYVIRLIQDRYKKGLTVGDSKSHMRLPTWTEVAIAFSVLLVAYGAIFSQKNSNEVKSTQKELARVSSCNLDIQEQVLSALNERARYTNTRADYIVDLVVKQRQYYFEVANNYPENPVAVQQALNNYLKAIDVYIRENQRVDQNIEDVPYPTTDELSNCAYP